MMIIKKRKLFAVLVIVLLIFGASCKKANKPVVSSEQVVSQNSSSSQIVQSAQSVQSTSISTNNQNSSKVTGGKITVQDYDFVVKPLPGSKSKELLNNPDRGLRLEAHFNPSDMSGAPGSQRKQNGIQILKDLISDYSEENPRLVQTYFELADFVNKDLDKNALDNMKKYLDVVRENKMKALILFAYEYDDKNPIGPTTDRILKHIQQLKPFLAENKDVIHAWQAGFIGLWGEWHNPQYTHDKKTVLNAILDARPEDVFVQVRMVDYKNVLDVNDPRRKWIGYADMYLVGEDHYWNSGNIDGTPQYAQETKEAPYILTDGEMPWGADTSVVSYVDPFFMAMRLQKHNFTSLSVYHNYRESGPFIEYSMAKWKKEILNANAISTYKLRVSPDYLKDENGKTIERSMFAYIRDHLGYVVSASNAKVKLNGNNVNVSVGLNNIGFAAPLAMKKIELVVFNENKQVLATSEMCSMVDLQPYKNLSIVKDLNVSGSVLKPGFGVGIRFVNSQGTSAKLSNDAEYVNGINVLGIFK